MYHSNIRNLLANSLKGLDIYKGYSSFAYKKINGEVVLCTNRACYSELKYVSSVKSELCIFIHSDKEYRKWELDYTRWMLNNSPWAKCWETKNARDALDKGAYINVDQPSTHVYSALIAMRQMFEYPGFKNSYIKLRKLGYSQTVSYITAQFLYHSAPNSQPIARSFHQSNHTFLHFTHSILEILRIVLGKKQFVVNQDTNKGPFYNNYPGRVHSLVPSYDGLDVTKYPSFFNLKGGDAKDIVKLAKAVKKKLRELSK